MFTIETLNQFTCHRPLLAKENTMTRTQEPRLELSAHPGTHFAHLFNPTSPLHAHLQRL